MTQAMTPMAPTAMSPAIARSREIKTVGRSGPAGGRLSGTPALYLLASLVVSLLAASSAPTPLYAIYQRHWGFSSITTTIVFGVYALAVLVALLTLGRLSDHVGRKPVLMVALLVQVATMVLFAVAGNVPTLLIARVIQGLATGAAIGAIGAGMLDIDPKRGQLTNAVTPGIGTAVGALVSALLVSYLPAPTHLVYYVLSAVFALQAVGVAVLRETVCAAPGALASLKPEITVPRTVRPHVVAAMPVMFAVWALAGLYLALGPALVARLVGGPAEVLGGLSPFVLAGVAAVMIFLLRNVAPGVVMLSGILLLLAGMVVTLVALDGLSLPMFFVGTAIAGAGFGLGFQGGIRTVVPLVAPHQRAGVLSLLYVMSYLGLGVPAVAAGFLTVHGAGLLGAARDYGLAVIVLAVLALLALARARRTATVVD
jgi:MFS family permease